VLAVSGTALAFVWGVLVPRDWHPEQSGIRVASALVLVVGAVAGLWFRRWTWVLAAGAAGLVGLTLWWLQLLGTGHTVDDLLSPQTDGIPNMITFAGALLVLLGGLMGTRKRTMSRG
jgi:LPXTG-motif cell wall-anchored protein